MTIKFRVAAIRTPQGEVQVELKPANEDVDVSVAPRVRGVLMLYFAPDKAPRLEVGQEIYFTEVTPR